MKFHLFFVLSVVLAIPTFGVSLLVLFLVKNWFDNRAMSALLSAAVASMKIRGTQEIYHVNRAAIKKVFSRFSDEPPVEDNIGQFYGIRGAAVYFGLVQHPKINNNQVFSARFFYMPGNGSPVAVKAAAGVDSEVLDVADIHYILRKLAIEGDL